MKSVFLKELREMLRDRRVIVGAFVMPILVVMMMIRLFGTIGASLGDEKATQIGVLKGTKPNMLVQALKQTPGFKIVEVSNADEGKAQVSKGKLKTLLVMPDIDIATAKQVPISAYYQSDESTSTIALRKIEHFFDEFNRQALQVVLKEQGIPASSAEFVKMSSEDISTSKGAGESLLVSFLPYLVVLFMFAGGMSIASDLVAGEKERGTLETLLISPLTRTQIALGKLGALTVFAIMSGLTTVIALIVAGQSDPSARKMIFAGNFHIGPVQIAAALLLVASLAGMFAATLLAISAWAKNMREAQTYMGVANFLVILPAVFSQIIGFTDAGQQLWVRLMPILSTAMGLREILLGKATAANIGLAIALNLVLAALLVLATMRMFAKEKILTRA